MSRPGFRPAGSGRKHGTPNGTTKALKDLILGALSDAGGQDYLRVQALQNPSAFMALVARVLPLQVKPDGADPRVDIKRIVHEHRQALAVIDTQSVTVETELSDP